MDEYKVLWDKATTLSYVMYVELGIDKEASDLLESEYIDELVDDLYRTIAQLKSLKSDIVGKL